jgi:hypothetical protein
LSKASQIVQDSINGYFYVVFGNQPGCSLSYKIIKSVGIPSIQNIRPCFTYALTGDTAWEYIDTNVNIDSMIIDPNYNNVFWAVENNIIYRGYLINNSYINFVQWYKNLAVGENWNSYITQPFLSASYNPVQVVSQNLLTNFSRVNAINAIDPVNTNYTYIQQAIRKNLLYVVNGTTISKYNYEGNVYDFNITDNHNYTVANLGIVHNSGKRAGSIANYLEPWHADIEDFLKLRLNTGIEEERADEDQ